MEVKKLRNYLISRNFFHEPVKSYQSIQESYYNYGVKSFSLDSHYELEKIIKATNYASDLNMYLRLAITNKFSIVGLSKKFGARRNQAISLLKNMKRFSEKIGITFHSGSQCFNPNAYKVGIEIASKIAEKAKVKLDFLNIGGGFPSKFPKNNTPSLKEYFRIIKEAFASNFPDNNQINLLAEPGRSLVSNSLSLVVKVNLRKKNNLYINDGLYGYMRDIETLGLKYPVKLFGKKNKTKLVPFKFFGPTCASNDFMKGPFLLPESVRENDFIEIGQMGAYTISMQSDFNGFYNEPRIFLESLD